MNSFVLICNIFVSSLNTISLGFSHATYAGNMQVSLWVGQASYMGIGSKFIDSLGLYSTSYIGSITRLIHKVERFFPFLSTTNAFF